MGICLVNVQRGSGNNIGVENVFVDLNCGTKF